MFFKKIEMHGFKSFAEPITIEFNQGITGVVGPNGSGKSNISDAVRWVLGEQSPKTLRGGKMEDVIFNGTAARKSRGMAEVTLVIDNSDGSLDIDYNEVAITRRMFRTGESEYHINGNQCRLKDIRNLIMDTGIGVDGYSLIGQGKIADIISNKTESRREIFEEAAGIVAYRTKKAEAERKLASTTDNMERVRDIIGEIEGRIDSLRDESIKAKEFVKLRDRHKQLEINIILKNVENLEMKNKYAKDDLAELENSLNALRAKKAEMDAGFAEFSSRNEALEEISNETREKLITAIDELNAVVNKGEVDKERLNAIKENTTRLNEELEQLAEKKERETANSESYALEKKKIDDEAEEANRKLAEKVDRYNELTAEMTALAEEADAFKNRMFDLSSAINSGKAEISSLERLQETLQERENTLLADKSFGDDSNRETLDSLNRIRTERESLASDYEMLKEKAEKGREEWQKQQAEERTLSSKYEELRIALGQLTARKKTIEEMEANYEGYNSAVKHVMKSGLSGIKGVVADLLEVPAGYETAIETALGASLQNIVCTDDDSAKKAIRSLKENKAGRMTFLPLASIIAKEKPEADLTDEAGFVGYGPDCVKADSEYDEIVRYLLGGVAIIDNMDNAVRASKRAGGYKLVTLEGEVINTAGAITGGRFRNKTANILDRKAEIAALAREIDEKTKTQKESTDRLGELRESISRFSREIGSLEGQIRAREHEILVKDNEISLSESTLSDIKSSAERLERELESIRAEKAKSVEMIGEIRRKIEENTKAIEEAEAASEAKLTEHDGRKSLFDQLSEEITAARIVVTSCDDRKSHADDIMERINMTIREIDSDIEVRNLQLEELQKEKETLTSGDGNADDQIRIKEEEKNRIDAYLTEVTEEKATLTAEMTRMNSDREELAGKLETLQNQKYDLDIRKTKNETQLENYKEKLWEDFEVSYIQAMEFKAEDFVMSSAVKENRQIKNRIKELGEVNVGAIEEYDTVKERYDFLTAQQADIQEAMDGLVSIIEDMDKTIRIKFKDSFDQIVVNFENKFKELFGGGHAELRLSDENNPLESNIDIIAQPPGKKLQNIDLLSGGEKTLTAIALMFAVLEAKPTPFCILDEVEAALDDANIERFITMLRKFSGIQFTLVTHQKATMERADVLYGVTMPEKGVSKVLSLSLEDNLEAYTEK